MASIPYYEKKDKLDMKDVDLSVELLNSSFNGHELCTILTKSDEGSTEPEATYIYKRNLELIFTNFETDDRDEIPDRYLTAGQIKLINDLGKMEIYGTKYKVEDVIISFNPDEDMFFATIKLKQNKKEYKIY
jgi:hypothetical protein